MQRREPGGVLVGPRQIAALVMASLIDARPTSLGALWAILTRALACKGISGDDAGDASST